MTRSIRADLEGVVHAYRKDGSVGAVLSKGDIVPDDVEVGDHLLAAADDTDDNQPPADPQTEGARSQVPHDGAAAANADKSPGADPGTPDDNGAGDGGDGLEKPAGNARTEEWENYADAIGVEYEAGAGRDEIRAAVAAHEATANEG